MPEQAAARRDKAVNARKPHLWWNQPWTIVESCTRCSAGCAQCWALGRLRKGLVEGKVNLRHDRLDEPLHWRKSRTVFVLNDWCHKDVPLAFHRSILDRVRDCPRHTFLMLTKRAKRQWSALTELYGHTRGSGNLPYPNLWAGVTCESNDYRWRIEELARTEAAVRFVNAHLLGPLNLVYGDRQKVPYREGVELAQAFIDKPPIDWLAVECNRPFRGDPKQWWDWCFELISPAILADIPVWVKQGPLPSGRVTHDLEDFPEWARRREFPKGGRER